MIITIIILILLAAISINALFKAKIIDTATDAVIKYEQEQYREKDMLDDLDNTIKDALIALGGNRPPIFLEEAHAIDITRTSMKITATAVDEDKDSDGNPDTLTYIFYFGTSEDNLVKEGSSIDTPAVFLKEGLTNGVKYYYRIDVTDGKSEPVKGTVGSAVTTENSIPSVGTPVVTRVANSTDKLTIAVVATDTDDEDLEYTFYRGTSSENITDKVGGTIQGKSGNTVTFTDTDLTMAQTYYYKVKVSDGTENAISANYGSERTWCLGVLCENSTEELILCTKCGKNTRWF